MSKQNFGWPIITCSQKRENAFAYCNLITIYPMPMARGNAWVKKFNVYLKTAFFIPISLADVTKEFFKCLASYAAFKDQDS